jgi:phosphate transport system permease protein
MLRLASADQRLQAVLLALTLVTTSIIGLIVLFVFLQASPVLDGNFLGFFDFTQPWYPLEGQRGMVPMIAASVLTTAGAIALALPFGIASALFAQYYGHPFFVRPYRWVVGLLAGVPSVVYGFWGLTVLVPLIAAYQAPGASLIAGVLILALMILPTVALTAEAAFMAVPPATLQAAHALGMKKSAITLQVLLPAARKGLIAGAILATGRALGETMALLMVTGNVVQMPSSIFDPVRTLTANIALEMAYAMGDHRASLFFSGLVLTALIIALTLAADWQVKRQENQS